MTEKRLTKNGNVRYVRKDTRKRVRPLHPKNALYCKRWREKKKLSRRTNM